MVGRLSAAVRAAGESAGAGAEVGHTEVDCGVPGCEVSHGVELLLGGGEVGLDRGDLAEPALFLGFLEPVEQVRVDLSQAGPLLGIWS
ncbi:hypothetical protein [Streptomyces sp. NPDC001828]|uniref:hypothetical protein n=1 Tax=Streptomyces sp. NPDC001828 TaxID=3364615 RepID=UPI00367A3E3A